MEHTHRFGRFEVRPDQRQLLVDGRPAALGARAFDLLMTLIEQRQRVVGKDELMARVWPGTVVEESNLTVQVSALRKVLGADALATVAGRGYRFTLAATAAADTTHPAPAPAADAPALARLPVERSSFIGREDEIAAVRAELKSHRLVTLTGIGGAGKTRLALQVGAQEAAHFADGVFFVDLAPVADPELVAQTLASACDLAPGDTAAGSERTFTDRLVAALAPRHRLLIVDNCEHLLEATADLVDRLLADCPRLVLLATSREALDVEGEQVMQVASLALPDDAVPGSVSDAMRLFADRAHAAQASFVLDERSWPAVAEICRRLDGIPLAIEFAAARVAHLSPSQLAERLGDRFRLLTGGRRRIARQQTLAATLDWSHGLLAEAEQIVFRRLGVFPGTFPLSAAEGVCSDGDEGRGGAAVALASSAVLDLLGSLVAKSLLTAGQDDAGGTRYRMLETVRLYALERLAAAGEAEAVRTHHRDHLLAWLEGWPMEGLHFRAGAINAVGAEIDNLRAAIDWSAAQDRPDLVTRIVVRMGGYLLISSFQAAGLALDEAMRHEGRLSPDERASGHAVLSWRNLMGTDGVAAMHHAERGIEAAAGRVSCFGAQAMSLLGFCQAGASSAPGANPDLIAAARASAAKGVAQSHTGMAAPWRASAEFLAGQVEMHLFDYAAAADWYARCQQTCREENDDVWLLAGAMCGQAASLHLHGHVEPALAVARRYLALPAVYHMRWPMTEAWSLELTPALVAGGDVATALGILRQRAATMRHNGVDLAPNHFFSIAAIAEFLRGHPERAALLLGAARSASGADRSSVTFRTPTSLAYYTQYLPLVRAALGPEAARQARDRGRALTVNQAFDYAEQGLG